MNEKFQARECVLNTTLGAMLGASVALKGHNSTNHFLIDLLLTLSSIISLVFVVFLIIWASRKLAISIAKRNISQNILFKLLYLLTIVILSFIAAWLPNAIKELNFNYTLFDKQLFSTVFCWFPLYIAVGFFSRVRKEKNTC